MHSERIVRRSFLLSALLAAGGAGLLAGCDGGEPDGTVTKQEDPSIKAKASMDYYKDNMLKKKK